MSRFGNNNRGVKKMVEDDRKEAHASRVGHGLTHFESDFLEDGYFAICGCGWKSLNAPSEAAAGELHRAHAQAKKLRAQ